MGPRKRPFFLPMNETCFYSGWIPQKYLYCETQLCGWLQQPSNTWSNIGYLIASILILRSNQAKTEKLLYFWATFILFVGSTLFHMSGTHVGKLLDVGAMLILSTAILSLSLKHFYSWNRKKTLTLFFTVLTISLAFLAIFDIANIPFTLSIAYAAWLEFRLIREKREYLPLKTLGLSLGIELGAVVFLLLDITQTWCNPDNHVINGHAVWHLLSAAAIYTFATARRFSQS